MVRLWTTIICFEDRATGGLNVRCKKKESINPPVVLASGVQ